MEVKLMHVFPVDFTMRDNGINPIKHIILGVRVSLEMIEGNAAKISATKTAGMHPECGRKTGQWACSRTSSFEARPSVTKPPQPNVADANFMK